MTLAQISAQLLIPEVEVMAGIEAGIISPVNGRTLKLTPNEQLYNDELRVVLDDYEDALQQLSQCTARAERLKTKYRALGLKVELLEFAERKEA